MAQDLQVSVDAALLRGRWILIYVPSVLFTLAVATGFIVGLAAGIQPWWAILAGFLAGTVIAMLWWSLTVTRWRIWALERVRNVHELVELAVEDKLIPRSGSWLERFEVRTPAQRRQLDALQVRFAAPDVPFDDPTVPERTVIRSGGADFWVGTVMWILGAALGTWMALTARVENMVIYGSLLAVLFGFFIFKNVLRLLNKRPAILLNAEGMATDKLPLQPWSSIHHERFEQRGTYKRRHTVLIYQHRDGEAVVNLSGMKTNRIRLRRLIRVYRARHMASTRLPGAS